MKEHISRRALFAAANLGAIAVAAGTIGAQSSPLFDNRPILAMLCYPGMFPLDLIGPEAVFSGMGTHRIMLFWKERGIVKSDSGIGIEVANSFSDLPEKLDIIFVPGGGFGTLKCMEDQGVLDFLKSRAKNAKYVTSVCTGSLILAAAGLLKGIKATSHWASRDFLADFGAIPIEARVVEDKNIITGGGVTSGIDMALILASRLAGEARAKAIQLNIEYDPKPPFEAGNPQSAGQEITDALKKSYRPFTERLAQLAKKSPP